MFYSSFQFTKIPFKYLVRNIQPPRRHKKAASTSNGHTTNGIPMIVRSEIINANTPVTTVTKLTNTNNCMMRDKSKVPSDRKSRGHRSLGDLQDLIKYKVNSKDGAHQKKPSRKSDGKDYKIVRREYIY